MRIRRPLLLDLVDTACRVAHVDQLTIYRDEWVNGRVIVGVGVFLVF